MVSLYTEGARCPGADDRLRTLDDNVLGAYKFLVENWREGDRIFLFGFSRGAWTARVLAGMIHLIGLLKPEQLNMCDSALGTYKRACKRE